MRSDPVEQSLPTPRVPRFATADYEALRRLVGAVYLRRDVVELIGPDAATYLQGQCSQDIDALNPGDTVEALLLAPEGKITVMVRITRTDAERFVLDCDSGWGTALVERLSRFKLRSRFELTVLDTWCCLALRGLQAADTAAALTPQLDVLVLGVSWGVWQGVDILGSPPVEGWERALSAAGVPLCDPAAAEALRIEAGVPVMGRELDDTTIPAEAHLLERRVSFTKGCYTGQELVARLDARGNRVPRLLRGIVAEGGSDGEDAGDLVGATLSVVGTEKPVGKVTSWSWCPGVGGPAGLAYVHRSVDPGQLVVLLSPAQPSPAGEQDEALPLDRELGTVEVRLLPLEAKA